VPVPGVVAADLVVVQTGLIFGELEGFFYASPGSSYPDQLGDRYRCAAAADVIGQFAGLANGAAHQQQMLIGAGIDKQPVIEPVSLAALAGRQALPAAFGRGGGQLIDRPRASGGGEPASQDTAMT
jgi:hypothetical protein